MRLLFDTHAFLWWDMEPTKLSTKVLEACQDDRNTLLLSVASLWEIQIKQGIGKLSLPDTLKNVVEKQQQDNEVVLLPITFDDILALETLPAHHKDPFDRLIIAQAKVQGAPLITVDPQIRLYDIDIYW